MKNSENTNPEGWGVLETDVSSIEEQQAKEDVQKTPETGKAVDVSAMSEKLEKEITENESPEMIKQHIKDFTEFLIEKYPQLSEDGKVNYYLSGSLALTLVVDNDKFEILDSASAPEVSVIGEKEIPEEARKELMAFVRKIGDLDYVPFEHWKKMPKEKRIVGKGGGGPSISELPESAKKAFNFSKRQAMVQCDPLNASVEHRIARIKINGKDVYITELNMIMAYKAVHMSEAFGNERKTHKFVKDFTALKKAMEKIYPPDELLETTKDLMMAYNRNSPNGNYIPYYHREFNSEFRKFFSDMIELDSDKEYLKKMEYGQERSIGILKILHRFSKSEDKEAIIDFINKQRGNIDNWNINTTSLKNRQIMADYILSDTAVFDKLKAHMPSQVKENDKDSIIAVLSENPYMFSEHGQAAGKYGLFEKEPASSDTLELLMKIDKDHVKENLNEIAGLIEMGVGSWKLYMILSSDYSEDPKIRKKLFSGITEAKKNLDKEQFESFITSLSAAAKDKISFDSVTFKSMPVNEADRPGNVALVFDKYGIKYE